MKSVKCFELFTLSQLWTGYAICELFTLYVECNDIFLEYYEILKKDEKFIQKLPLVDDNIKFAKGFNDNINEIAEAHHILLEKTLKEREIVF